jgi:hypothetical protein
MISILLHLSLLLLVISSYIWGAQVFLPQVHSEGKSPLLPRVLLWLFSPMMLVAVVIMMIADRDKDSK